MNVPPDYVRTIIHSSALSIPSASVSTRFCALLALLFVLTLPTTASADYRISAYKATPGFNQIMKADYAQAATAASSRTPIAPKYAMATNLCVSEVMNEALDSALKSCNKALDLLAVYTSVIFTELDRRESTSELLSNRGVVLALQGDLAAAESDFARAAELDSENTNASQNLAYLRSKQVASRNLMD